MMSTFAKAASGVVLAAVLILIFIATMGGGMLSIQSWFLPAQEEIRYETTQNSTAYVRGKIQSLHELRRAYAEAQTDQHKTMLREMIIEEYVTVDEDKLPENLNNWIKSEIKPNQ